MGSRRIVTVGWDGHSHPILRYHDEIHLPEQEQERLSLPDQKRAGCFAKACRDAEVQHG